VSGAVACFSANDAQEDPAGYLNGLTVEFEIDGVLNGKRAVAGMMVLSNQATALDILLHKGFVRWTLVVCKRLSESLPRNSASLQIPLRLAILPCHVCLRNHARNMFWQRIASDRHRRHEHRLPAERRHPVPQQPRHPRYLTHVCMSKSEAVYSSHVS